jgi:hypothetical protein
VKNKYLFSSLSLLLIFNLSFSQQIVRSTMSCLGSTYADNGMLISQTVGQSSNTMVFNNGNMKLNQGFQQPIYSMYVEPEYDPIDFQIYPNPSKGESLLKLNNKLDDYTVTVHDAQGKIIEIIPDQSESAMWLKLHEYKPGSYTITINTRKRIGSRTLILLKH